MDATPGAIAAAARRALGSDRASRFVHDGEDVSIVAVHTTETDPEARAFLEGSVGLPFLRLPICRLLVEPRSSWWRTSIMSVREPRAIPAAAVAAIRSLGGLAALAIANARLHASVLRSLASAEERAAVDPLTGRGAGRDRDPA